MICRPHNLKFTSMYT